MKEFSVFGLIINNLKKKIMHQNNKINVTKLILKKNNFLSKISNY